MTKTNTNNTSIKKLLKNLVIPFAVFLCAIILAISVGLNRGMDFKGGISLSVVAGVEYDLTDSKNYTEFKGKIDNILQKNGVNGEVYTIGVNQQQENYLEVKFEYDKSNKTQLINSIKKDVIDEFDFSENDVNNNYYVVIDQFGASATMTSITSTLLASGVALLAMCVYLAIRNGLNSGVLTFIVAIFNCFVTLSLIMITRIKINLAMMVAPVFIIFITVLLAFIYSKKIKYNLTKSNKYERESNKVLASETLKQTMPAVLKTCGIFGAFLLLMALVNVTNSVFFTCISLLLAVASAVYSYIFIYPEIFALSYVRKVKQKKTKEKDKQKKLTEEEVYTETDLDNLVSN